MPMPTTSINNTHNTDRWIRDETRIRDHVVITDADFGVNSDGIARVHGMANVQAEELVE